MGLTRTANIMWGALFAFLVAVLVFLIVYLNNKDHDFDQWCRDAGGIPVHVGTGICFTEGIVIEP
jgi:hypothetical protein